MLVFCRVFILLPCEGRWYLSRPSLNNTTVTYFCLFVQTFCSDNADKICLCRLLKRFHDFIQCDNRNADMNAPTPITLAEEELILTLAHSNSITILLKMINAQTVFIWIGGSTHQTHLYVPGYRYVTRYTSILTSVIYNNAGGRSSTSNMN